VEKLIFTNSWQQFFAKPGLKSFKDFFNFPNGKLINKNNKRDVQILCFNLDGKKHIFYLKRFHQPHFKDMLLTWQNFGKLCSQAENEWKNSNILFENDIQTFKPVCFGHQTRWGIERQSFLVTKELKGEPFSHFVTKNWSKLTQKQKEKIIIQLAISIRQIHDAGISLPDLYVWHIFIRPEKSKEQEEYNFAFIDLNRMKHNVTNKNEQLKNLGRLDHSMTDKYFDENSRQLFIKSYSGDDGTFIIDDLTKKVKKYSRKVSRKRNPKPY